MIKILKKILLLLLILVLVRQAYAQVDNYDTISYLDLMFNLESSVLTSSLVDPQLEYMLVNLSLVPQTDKNQVVKSLNPSSDPQSQVTVDNTILYRWDSLEQRYSFFLASQVRSVNYVHEIPHIPFPVLDVPAEVEKYLSPTQNIDITPEIIQKATELTAGQTDLFEAVFSIADWTKSNIKYDLNTLTANAVQKSSWVLENKEGVCDEMTALFISMLRSVGVPARFVTGMVYTNTLNDFGNHGWAEVYFPGYGWAPFDVTFGEYGYIDPGHIKLSDSTDSASPSVKYSWKEYHVEVRPNDLTLRTRVAEHGPDIEPRYKLKAEPLANNFGEGSYFPIKVSVTNPTDYYVSTTLTVTKAPKIIGENTRQIFLRPRETSSFYFISHITDYLDPDYIYTSYIEVQDTFGSKASTKVSYAKTFPQISRQRAQDLVGVIKEIDKVYSRNLSISCNLSKPYYYNYETAKVACILRNIANTPLTDIKVCILEKCQTITLGIGARQDVIVDLSLDKIQSRQIAINAQGKDVFANYFLTLNVYEKPVLTLEDINYPQYIGYNEDFELSFSLQSPTKLDNVVLQAGKNQFELGELYGLRNVTLMLNSKDFTQDKIGLKIDFEDENKNTYKYEQDLKIKVENVPFYIQLWNFIKSLF